MNITFRARGLNYLVRLMVFAKKRLGSQSYYSQLNLSTTVTLGKLSGDRNIRNMRGDRHIQGRYIEVSLYISCHKLNSQLKREIRAQLSSIRMRLLITSTSAN